MAAAGAQIQRREEGRSHMVERSSLEPDTAGSVAFLITAHNDPVHVRRLIRALDPFPVFLHCDVRTPQAEFQEMTDGLPAEQIIEPRIACGWAEWGLVSAEIESLRRALTTTSAEHFVVGTGSDYPLASTADISRFLASHRGKSIAAIGPMPRPNWGRSGGLARLRYRHYAWRKQMIRIPVPRSLPRGIVPSGGGQQKILSRRHAEIVVQVHDSRPDLVKFWHRSWSADETFVPTILLSPEFGVNWATESVDAQTWWIGWDGTRRKSPPVLNSGYFDRLRQGRFPRDPGEVPKLLARKFTTLESEELLDRIDEVLRSLATTP